MDVESWIGAPGWINDEVGKRFVEGSNRLTIVLLEGEERVHRCQEGEHLLDIDVQERCDGRWRNGIHSQGHGAEHRADLGVDIRVVFAESVLKD